jgi:hypothetical protein
MAKAAFHRNQKVFVKPVGTWATVERVLPQWVKGLDEPLKVHYDVGLGRDFSANELVAEQPAAAGEDHALTETWRIGRSRNRWRDPEETPGHPYPGTFPVVMTDEHDWGGWRVPIAEYDRNPERIEFQARIIESAPQLMRLAKTLARLTAECPDELPSEIVALGKAAAQILRQTYARPGAAPVLAETSG